jgi:group I intron endonuclease
MERVIYKIVNLVNDKFYVGSTVHKKVRFRQHRKLLRAGRHHCKHLQAAWNKYGEDKFDFRVVQDVPEGLSLQDAEDVWLKAHVGKPYCYNSGYRSDAPWRDAPAHKTPNFGKTWSAAMRAQIGDALKAFYAEDYLNHPRVGTQHSDATKEQIRQKKLANPTRAWLGKARSEETKAKISAAQMGKPKAPGRKVSEEGRAKLIAAARRGEDSPMYGKRPANADDLQKAVYVRKPNGELVTFPSLSFLRDNHGVSVATTIRACKSGKPVQTGAASGWTMSYAPFGESLIPPEYEHLPRTRQLAKEQGAEMYFTGVPCSHGHIAPRRAQGQCVECQKEAWKAQNERNKGKPKSEASKAAGKRYYEKKKLAALQAA